MPFFAKGESLCTDSLNNCYYIPIVTQSPYYRLYYIYPIKNNKVIFDIPFNFGDSLVYDEWREKLQEKINEILNKKYTYVDDNLNDIGNGISLYPNPVDSYLNIMLNEKIFGRIEILIYNNLGELAKSLRAFDVSGNVIKLSLQDLASGFYFLRIINVGHTYLKSITIIH